MTPPLGPRASLLLGMLVGSPRTPQEIHDLIGRAIDERIEGAFLGIDVDQALRSVHGADVGEIRALLLRLEEFGFARRVAVDDAELFAVVPL